MRLDHLRNLNRQFKRRRRFVSGHQRRLPATSALNERQQFPFKWLILFNGDFIPGYLAVNQSINLPSLILIVERQVSGGCLLKHSDLAHFFWANSTSRQISHAPALKSDPRVRDILALTQDRDSHRVDAFYRRTHQMQDDLKIMNHEIKHHPDFNTTKRILR